jgi:hypothetical protein
MVRFAQGSDRKILLMRRDSACSIAWSGISLDSRYITTEDNTLVRFDLEAIMSGGGSQMPEDARPFLFKAAASAVFERVRQLQEELALLAFAAEPVHELFELTNVFEPLGQFRVKLSELATVLEPMRNFQDQLRLVFRQFASLEGLDRKLNQLCAAFSQSLSQLAAALEPAAALQDRLVDLAVTLGPSKTLRQEFSALAESFQRKALP